ncbi:MAG: FAD-dependent oxidoreductase [Thermoleophilia bacterium]|nr:FAD-dependent oxidoreductase [Thermoleophilia bacterium]
MARDADVVVVGAGVAGAATARALAAAGRGVLLLDRFEPGHRRGSSHGGSRIFRLNYPDERYVRMALSALEGWRELEAECGERLILPTGVLDLGPSAMENGRALAACGVAYEELDAREIARRWPLRVEPGETGLFQPSGGITLAARACAAFLEGAVAAGAELRAPALVRSLEPGRNTVRLDTTLGPVVARAVVVTAGSWAPTLLATAGIELAVVPTRETVCHVALPGAEELPPLIDYGRTPKPGEAGLRRSGQAVFSLATPGLGLKVGLHHGGPITDPDDDPQPDAAIAAWIAAWARGRYLGVGDDLGAETCLYTNTADQRFVLERHGRIVVGSACSGHGFKFAPLVGRTLAALATGAAR